MNYFYLLLLAFPVLLSAQTPTTFALWQESEKCYQQALQINKSRTHKETATGWRQIAHKKDMYNASAWVGKDSSRTTYNSMNLEEEHITLVYDTGTDTWKDRSRSTSVYTASGYISSFTNENFDDPLWRYTSRTIYTYDGNNNIIQTLYESWDGTAWQPSSKTSLTYNQNLRTTALFQSWFAGAWKNNSQALYLYTASGLMQQYTLQYWSAGAWENTDQQFWAYDANGNNILDSIMEWSSSLSVWENVSKNEALFDANNNMISEAEFDWTAGSWEETGRATYTYDANNNKLSGTNLDPDGSGGWVNVNRTIYTYSPQNERITEALQRWVSGAWDDYIYHEYTYDENSNMLTATFDDLTGGTTTHVYRDFYYYEPYTVGGISRELIAETKAYPNPFSKQFTISFTSHAGESATLNIADISGKVVQSIKVTVTDGENHMVVGGHGLSSGLYFYELSVGNNVIKGKLLYQE